MGVGENTDVRLNQSFEDTNVRLNQSFEDTDVRLNQSFLLLSPPSLFC